MAGSPHKPAGPHLGFGDVQLQDGGAQLLQRHVLLWVAGCTLPTTGWVTAGLRGPLGCSPTHARVTSGSLPCLGHMPKSKHAPRPAPARAHAPSHRHHIQVLVTRRTGSRKSRASGPFADRVCKNSKRHLRAPAGECSAGAGRHSLCSCQYAAHQQISTSACVVGGPHTQQPAARDRAVGVRLPPC